MLKPRRPRPIYAGRDKWRKAGADREKKGQEGEGLKGRRGSPNDVTIKTES
jgi:hypothetical protein